MFDMENRSRSSWSPEKLAKYREAERNRQKKARFKIRIQVDEFRKSCMNCGETHVGCLQFHHRDPSTKLFRIQQGVAEKVPFAKILKEIAKCDVLCANCHAKLHWKERR